MSVDTFAASCGCGIYHHITYARQLFVCFAPPRVAARAAMALATLSGDEQCIIFSQLCNTLDPGIAVAFGSASSELRTLTQALLQQLKADHEVAAALLLTRTLL